MPRGSAGRRHRGSLAGKSWGPRPLAARCRWRRSRCCAGAVPLLARGLGSCRRRSRWRSAGTGRWAGVPGATCRTTGGGASKEGAGPTRCTSLHEALHVWASAGPCRRAPQQHPTQAIGPTTAAHTHQEHQLLTPHPLARRGAAKPWLQAWRRLHRARPQSRPAGRHPAGRPGRSPGRQAQQRQAVQPAVQAVQPAVQALGPPANPRGRCPPLAMAAAQSGWLPAARFVRPGQGWRRRGRCLLTALALAPRAAPAPARPPPPARRRRRGRPGCRRRWRQRWRRSCPAKPTCAPCAAGGRAGGRVLAGAGDVVPSRRHRLEAHASRSAGVALRRRHSRLRRPARCEQLVQGQGIWASRCVAGQRRPQGAAGRPGWRPQGWGAGRRAARHARAGLHRRALDGLVRLLHVRQRPRPAEGGGVHAGQRKEAGQGVVSPLLPGGHLAERAGGLAELDRPVVRGPRTGVAWGHGGSALVGAWIRDAGVVGRGAGCCWCSAPSRAQHANFPRWNATLVVSLFGLVVELSKPA